METVYANIRRLGRILAVANNRGIGEGLDNPFATEADILNDDVGTQEEYEHADRMGLNGRPIEKPTGTGMDRESMGMQS
jgi:hypothetical protein